MNLTSISATSPESYRQIASLHRPIPNSHKGQNGKVLIIGGSELFHAPIIWSAEVASRLVDMLHVVSPSKNNEDIIRTHLKKSFLDGIVVSFNHLESYLQEDNVILIGPGMPRSDGQEKNDVSTYELVNDLVIRYPSKRWVIDGGALQEINPDLLNGNMIITPHHREWLRLLEKSHLHPHDPFSINTLSRFSLSHAISTPSSLFPFPSYLTILLKGPSDIVVQGNEVIEIKGGHPGLTKGGTGDVLAGLVAGLYTQNDSLSAAKTASILNKQAGELLGKTRDNFYNSSDLVTTLGNLISKSTKI